MAEPLKEYCPDCKGAGTVPRERRKMENGEPDPADFRLHAICEKCGGSGVIPLNKSRSKEPSNIADMSG